MSEVVRVQALALATNPVLVGLDGGFGFSCHHVLLRNYASALLLAYATIVA